MLLVLLYFSFKSVYPLSLRTFSYWYLDELKIFPLEEFLDKRSLINFGNWMIICGGWFEDLWIYNNKSFDFLYGLYVPLFKLNVMSRRSTTLRLVSTSMAKTMYLNVLIILVHHHYVSNNRFYWLVSLENTTCKYQQVRIPLHRQNFPLSHRSRFLFVSFSMLHCC